MQFVRESVDEYDEVLCPCRSCLNRERRSLQRVEHHLHMYGMATTYDKWVHHGELDAEAHHAESDAQEHYAEPDEQAHHAQPDAQGHYAEPDEPAHHAEPDVQARRFGDLEEEDQYEDDRIPDLMEDLYNAEDHAEDQGSGEESIFAKVLEEATQALHEGSKFYGFLSP